MRAHVFGWLVGCLLLTVCSGVASADPIRVIVDGRLVSAEAAAFNSLGHAVTFSREQHVKGDNLSASAQATFGEATSLSQSQLTSAIAAGLHQFSGVATASSSIVGPGHGSAVALFEVSFELHQPHVFDFEGNFEALGFGAWQAHLVQSPAVHQLLRFNFISGPVPAERLPIHIRQRGSLDPGGYRLLVRSDTLTNTLLDVASSGASRFDFVFGMSPVPEPSSLLLVGGGVLTLIGRAHRACRKR